MTELRQDDHHMCDLAKVICWLREYCGLEPPQHQADPARGLKCFREVLHSDQ